VEGNARGLTRDTGLVFAYEGLRKPVKTSIGIVGVPFKIRIGHLPNTNELYRMNQIAWLTGIEPGSSSPSFGCVKNECVYPRYVESTCSFYTVDNDTFSEYNYFRCFVVSGLAMG
jgi:hypothetical protein